MLVMRIDVMFCRESSSPLTWPSRLPLDGWMEAFFKTIGRKGLRFCRAVDSNKQTFRVDGDRYPSILQATRYEGFGCRVGTEPLFAMTLSIRNQMTILVS